jgi:C4-dicarboxylate-specific signal transduction histidine kinase
VILQSAMIVFLMVEHRGRRVAEKEARRRLLEVAQMDRILTAGTMSASIAHELNQPLTAILSNTETAQILLATSNPDLDQVKEILADIHRDDQRAAEIISHMRSLLKRGTLELQKVDLNKAIEETIHIIAPEAAKRGILIARDSDPVSPQVQADPVHLQQVILNIAMNAMDAMHESASGKRSLGFQVALLDDSQARVTISDTGPGIPADNLNTIFKSFVTTKQHGTGLGLSIARTIIETYGGKIWAENRADGGTAFKFNLPLAPSS